MKRAGGIVVVIPLFILFISLCSASQTPDPNSPALIGIKAIFVLIEDLPQGATKIGLTTEKLRAVTELKLRQEGLSVPTYPIVSYEDPYLYISVNVVGEAFSVEVSLRDNVVIKRGRSITCRAAIWLNSVIGEHRGDGDLIILGLQEVLDEFINDLHKANPKKQP